MHKTEGANHSSNEFTDGPPGTRLEEDWCNAIQNEVVNVVEGAGLVLKTATSETGDQLLAAIRALCVEPDEILGKNALINGDFRVNQRLATYEAGNNDDDMYVLDRWILLSNGNDVVDVTQATDVPTGALNSIGLDVEDANLKFGILQVIEQKNCQHMIGGNVSLSFQARVSDITKLDNIKAAVISWDGAADTVTSDVVNAWNAEDTNPTLEANWTYEHTPVNLNVTASWAKFTIPNIAIDTATTTNIGVLIWSDVTDTTAGHFLYITQVQLEKNAVSSEYDWRSIGNEEILCQRYYCNSYSTMGTDFPGDAVTNGEMTIHLTAVNDADHEIFLQVRFPVSMRNEPTVTIYDEAGNIGKVTMAAGDNIAGAANQIGDGGFLATGTNGIGSVNRTLQAHYTAEIEL